MRVWSRSDGVPPGEYIYPFRLPIAGSAKIHQEWEKTWREWHACITESGDEKGKYILQEHHWEEPYLDTSALAEDLELIAARMRPLLARVMDEELDPDFGFANEIGLTVEEIGLGLPEWMDPSQYEGCAFGPEVTGCLLEWEWRAAQRDEMSAFEFVDTIRQLEHEANGISFNQDTISTFILECDEVAQRGILQGIVAHRNAPHWEYVLGSPYSGWFLLYQELCQRWQAPVVFLRPTSHPTAAQSGLAPPERSYVLAVDQSVLSSSLLWPFRLFCGSPQGDHGATITH